MLPGDGRGAASRAFTQERPTTHSSKHLLGEITLENRTDSVTAQDPEMSKYGPGSDNAG